MGCGASAASPTKKTDNHAAAPKKQEQPFPASSPDDPKALDDMPDIKKVPSDMLSHYLKRLYEIEDENGDGVLQPQEFEKLLKRSGFGFSQKQTEYIMAKADANGDGVLDLGEFVPVMTLLLTDTQPVGDQFWASVDQIPFCSDIVDYSQAKPEGDHKVFGDYWHSHYALRIAEEGTVQFLGCTFFFPEEFEIIESTTGDAHVQFEMRQPSLDRARTLWNLALQPDGSLAGEVYKAGQEKPAKIAFRRLSSSDQIQSPSKDVAKLDRMMMADMKADGGKSGAIGESVVA